MAAPGKARKTAAVIRTCAIRLFSSFGFQGTTQRQLAAASGINVSSLYNHIDSKEALLADLMTTIMVDLVGEMERTLDIPGTPSERFRAAMQVHVEFHAERADEVFIGNSELRSLLPEARQRVVALRDRYEHMLESMVAAGVETGDFDVTDTRLVVYALMAVGAHISSWYRTDGELDLDEIASAYSDLFLRGLTAGTATDLAPLLLERAHVDRLLERQVPPPPPRNRRTAEP